MRIVKMATHRGWEVVKYYRFREDRYWGIMLQRPNKILEFSGNSLMMVEKKARNFLTTGEKTWDINATH